MWLLLESTVTANRSVSMFLVRLAAPHPLPRMTRLGLVGLGETSVDMLQQVPKAFLNDPRRAESPSFAAILRFIGS